MIIETPDEWDNPFERWYERLVTDFPLVLREINVPRVTNRIHVKDDGVTYVRCHTPTGTRFIEESKLKDAETLGLSVRRA